MKTAREYLTDLRDEKKRWLEQNNHELEFHNQRIVDFLKKIKELENEITALDEVLLSGKL